ncbi:hypothetical protein [Nocardia niwae]|uniref:hypothetical protein n=1 Tax=Nocardia niwae TaxID=626084 RepID=UPI000AD9AF1F|nr:hypothetical protein [Nocardia niwae]
MPNQSRNSSIEEHAAGAHFRPGEPSGQRAGVVFDIDGVVTSVAPACPAGVSPVQTR